MPRGNGVKVETEAPFNVFPDIAPYQKTRSTGPAEYNGLRSTPQPDPPPRAWGGGSYDHRTGRACNWEEPGYSKSKCDYKVRHTTDRNR